MREMLSENIGIDTQVRILERTKMRVRLEVRAMISIAFFAVGVMVLVDSLIIFIPVN